MVENNLLPHGAGKVVLIYSELKKKIISKPAKIYQKELDGKKL